MRTDTGKSLLSQGIIPHATGANVNPGVRRATIEKLNALGYPTPQGCSVVVLCRKVATISGSEIPEPNASNGWLGRWVLEGTDAVRAIPVTNNWQRPAWRPDRAMAFNLERAMAHQGPLSAMSDRRIEQP